ncbi:MerC domain-containing protein [Sphingomonas sp. DT-207]|uniref:MerC domain-containing protein n=1 Tax=Sphingomonas sp. DT-207 TaxID=3396167 RepID=UPI003F1CF451
MNEANPVRARRNRLTDISEGIAVSASFLCLIHCLVLPFLLLLLPGILGLFVGSPTFHGAALAVALPAALIAFRHGYRQHRAPLPVLLGLSGSASLVAGLLPVMGEGAETVLTVAGSLMLVAGHALNWRLRKCAGRHG